MIEKEVMLLYNDHEKGDTATSVMKKKARALTIIEMIFALWMAAIVVISIMMCFGYTYSRAGKNKAIATSIAKRAIEEYKGNTRGLREVVNGDGTFSFVENVQDTDSGDTVPFKAEGEVTAQSSDAQFYVKVKVSWPDKVGARQNAAEEPPTREIILDAMIMND